VTEPLAPGRSPPPDTRFGSYRLIRIIGRGGMGEVWHAHDDEHDRNVALKVLGE
jgi:serine/threonine protein kinase